MRNAVLFTLLAASALIPAVAQQSLSGRRAPSFSLPDSAFKQYDILDYRGKWLLLDFFNTDCPHCKELSRKLEAWKTKHGSRVAVLSVLLTPPENQQTAAKYISETKITSPIVFDMSQVAIAYFKATPQRPSFDTPHVFAIDPGGMIVRDWNQPQLAAPGFLLELDQLISGPAGKAAKK